jgi:hypothetical protein
MENKYIRGAIYKIVDSGNNKAYYGSTINTLISRFENHKQSYKRWKAGKLKTKTSSFVIFDEFGLDNCKIELVELFPCNSRIELLRKEGGYIKNNECVNKLIAGRTKKEYYNECRARVRKIKDLHNDPVKERRRQYHKEYSARVKEQRRTLVI